MTSPKTGKSVTLKLKPPAPKFRPRDRKKGNKYVYMGQPRDSKGRFV